MITQDTHIDSEGCTFVPIILGSDKTTVSVATGQNEYYPLYLSIGNVHNSVRQAHRGAVTVLAFLANPKGMSTPPTCKYISRMSHASVLWDIS